MPPFLRTTAFRLTLLSAGLFALSSFVILALVYAATVGASMNRADAAITGEIAQIEARYAAGGAQAANRYIVQRSVGGGEFLYLFQDPERRRISGNISALPAVPADAQGRVRFVYERAPADGAQGGEGRNARGQIVVLAGGHRVFVGMDVEDETRFISNTLNAVLLASALALGLGIISGAVVSRRFSKRLDAINAAARAIRAGRLETRAPRTHTGDELDELSENFNAMLDRVEHLMQRMRTAGDSIAHDLRLPLTRLRGRLEGVLVEAEDPEAREAALQRAIADVDELLRTFHAVLSLARLQAGERRRAFERLDLTGLLADVAELYEPVCEDQGLEFACDCPAGLWLMGDRELIAQAVANILDNAVKYTPEGGAVVLRGRFTGAGEAEVSVTDTGPGIPMEHRARVLERFVRLEKSRSLPGVGLGLSLVQAIAEVHGARLTLDEGPGAVDGHGPGLRIALTFPAGEG
ncbi:MAG: HAMP domain-containing protein [Oceanicaulis sp.]|nr:HAMP domain-containing protein [Oceanicaulis sp.]